MYINKIKLINFRNYENQEIIFNKNLNIIYGDNAQGKTNILEAIFISSLGKSFRTNKDNELININKENSIIEIEYEKIDRNGKICLNISDKKTFYLNGVKLKKISELLGNIYVVLFNPDDINILKDGPSKRRKFLNIIISQLRPNYVHLLNIYMKVLEQRNIYLKQIKFENKTENLLDIWDEKLAELGEKIYIYRKEILEKFSSKINYIHSRITNNNEKIEIEYNSFCKNKNVYLQKLKDNRKIDIKNCCTKYGIHKDDFSIFINNLPVNIFGSQGQQRTIIISLKLSELEIIYDEIGEYPIFLLDDFMSELDKKRINNFLENIKENQIIITCTEKLELYKNINFYKVENGKVL